MADSPLELVHIGLSFCLLSTLSHKHWFFLFELIWQPTCLNLFWLFASLFSYSRQIVNEDAFQEDGNTKKLLLHLLQAEDIFAINRLNLLDLGGFI